MDRLKPPTIHTGPAWDRDSFFHQNYDFLSHVTIPLLSLSPMSELVKE
jgi:hypothetical protein